MKHLEDHVASCFSLLDDKSHQYSSINMDHGIHGSQTDRCHDLPGQFSNSDAKPVDLRSFQGKETSSPPLPSCSGGFLGFLSWLLGINLFVSCNISIHVILCAQSGPMCQYAENCRFLYCLSNTMTYIFTLKSLWPTGRLFGQGSCGG